MNSVQLLGNICSDPEMRYTANNVAVTKFSIALNERYKKADGEVQETAHFIDCVVWKKQAEVIAKHFRKGDKIAVTGKLTQDRWEDKQSGQNRSKVLVTVLGFDFCGDRKQAQGGPRTQQQSSGSSMHDSDIPFAPHGIDGRAGV